MYRVQREGQVLTGGIIKWNDKPGLWELSGVHQVHGSLRVLTALGPRVHMEGDGKGHLSGELL